MGDHEDLLLPLAPLLAIGVNMVVHIVAMRVRVFGVHLGSVIFGFIIGLAAVVAITAWVVIEKGLGMADSIAYELMNAVSYGGLGYCYFTAINLVFTSLRIYMIRELLESPDQSLPADRLKLVYDLDAVLGKRLERLVAWGQIHLSGDRYYIAGSPVFLILDRQIRRVRSLLLGADRGGLMSRSTMTESNQKDL